MIKIYPIVIVGSNQILITRYQHVYKIYQCSIVLIDAKEKVKGSKKKYKKYLLIHTDILYLHDYTKLWIK